jgi:hypothetical protein
MFVRRASRALTALAATLALSSLTMAAVATQASAAVGHLRPIQIVRGLHLPDGQVQSTNWSGYATKGTTFKAVSGKWTQPAVNCAPAPNGIVAFWVGIDGYTSGTVEQDGTLAECNNGVPTYFDWWEMYPTNAVQIVHSIGAGDVFVSSVTYTGSGHYTLTVTDKTRPSSSFTTVQTCVSCVRTSAEWIAEAPCCVGQNPYPMPNWGTMKFARSSTTSDAGHTGTISDPAWQNDEITMVNNSSQVKAQPGPLLKGGAQFTVTWVRAQ